MNHMEIRKKAEALTAQLTLSEKIGMLHGAQLFQTKGVERLGIPPLKMSDGPMGVRQEFEPASWKPAGNSDDFVTYLPCNSALAATWNRRLAHDCGSVLGAEARGRGKDVILAPGVNIKRSPLCGRNFEYFSEDPYLTGELAVPFIRGVQEWDVAACVKHFAVNNQETERLWVDVEAEEEALREIYLPAFHEALIKGGAYTVMGAYNKLYGEHCCQSDFLLDGILRKEWGWDGVVISDWGAVHDTQKAAGAGLDIEMSVTDNFDSYCFAEPLKRMVEAGEIPEAVIDEKVTRVLMLMLRLHMLDKERKSGAYNTPEHRCTALEAARESVVLLKNRADRLPLAPEKVKRLLVIGDNASAAHANDGGSAEIRALYEITPLMGIKLVLGGNAEVKFARGYCREEKEEDSGVSWQADSLTDNGPENGSGAKERETKGHGAAKNDKKAMAGALEKKRAELFEEAVRLAGEYEDVIFIGGLNHEQDSEGNDRRDMKLPYGQEELIRRLLQVNPRAVVVLQGGSPVEMGSFLEDAPTVVWSWYAGMEGGRALAEVLFGKVNPSGKLPETFWKTHMDCPAHALGEFPGKEKVRYREGLFVGYRYQEKFGAEPGFCFGHGLSYTTFAYTDGALLKTKDGWRVVCNVKNTGAREGAETVQVYLAPKEEKEGQPLSQLKGFEKVFLAPGETKRVEIVLEEDCEAMTVRLGSSLKDIRFCLEAG